MVLDGSGGEKIAFRYPGERGKSAVREHAFEGIVPNLERRYRETDSAAVKEELAKYLNTAPARNATARGCGGGAPRARGGAQRSTKYRRCR